MKLAALAMLAVLPAMNAEDSPLMEGKLDSPVRVLIYEDLQCSDCALFRRMLDERLLPKYGARVAFEHRDFPLPKHDWARMAAVVSRYFQDSSQEAALAWRRETMRDQKQITAATFAAYVQSFAGRRGLDGAKALAALTDERLNRLVSSDYEEGVARGIARTPTALVNGEPFIETFTVEQISAGIEKALAEAGVK
jgi:protein-disulfide isomerase